jgi:hypothetical protein
MPRRRRTGTREIQTPPTLGRGLTSVISAFFFNHPHRRHAYALHMALSSTLIEQSPASPVNNCTPNRDTHQLQEVQSPRPPPEPASRSTRIREEAMFQISTPIARITPRAPSLPLSY